MSAALRLESFSAPRLAPSLHNAEELAAEYARGVADGRVAARNDQMDELIQALALASATADAHESIRAEAIRDTLGALRPVLKEITRLLATRNRSALADLLFEELSQSCSLAAETACTVTIDAELHDALTEKTNSLGLKRLCFQTGPHAEIRFTGGRVQVDAAGLPQKIDALLDQMTNHGEAPDEN